MATEIISTPNNVQNTTLSNGLAFKNLQSTLSELRRLSTFRLKNDNMHPTLSKGLLSKIGFVYLGIENKAQCEGCGFEIELSNSDSDLFELHIQQSPECPFVLNYSDVFSRIKFLVSNTSQADNSNLNCQNGMNHDHQDNTNPQKLFLDSLSNATIDKLRANTFSNWPSITPNAQDMIIAGWSYTNIADRVICIFCDALYHKWTESDRPYEIHRLKSPQCQFVLSVEKKSETAHITNITITTTPNTQTAVEVANSAYALACRRYETFQNWPHTEMEPLPPVESFVDAGFYYTG
jgi:hypothetical protein